MNPYITFREKDSNGNLQYYILQKEHPHYVGIITAFNDGSNWAAPIPGYNLYVLYSGTLIGNLIPLEKTISKNIELVLNNMAAWFWSERIVSAEWRYKKFKINSNGILPTDK